MGLIYGRASQATAAMVAMVLQPSQVYTQGDSRKTICTLDVGLTQGGPESPFLFNIEADVLMHLVMTMISTSLAKHQTPEDPLPAKAFADDLLLQHVRLLDAKRALAACSSWASVTGQTFTVSQGKSASLTREGDPDDLGLTVSGKRILQAHDFQYLGVTLTARGPTDSSLNRRVAAASMLLHPIGCHAEPIYSPHSSPGHERAPCNISLQHVRGFTMDLCCIFATLHDSDFFASRRNRRRVYLKCPGGLQSVRSRSTSLTAPHYAITAAAAIPCPS